MKDQIQALFSRLLVVCALSGKWSWDPDLNPVLSPGPHACTLSQEEPEITALPPCQDPHSLGLHSQGCPQGSLWEKWRFIPDAEEEEKG